jgi:hypothetical protein
MVLGVNAYREICTLHLAGQILVDKKLVLRLANTAADKAKKIVDKIKAALAANEEAAKSRAGRGFAAKNRANSLQVRAVPRAPLDLTGLSAQARKIVQEPPAVAAPAAVVTEAKSEELAEVLPEAVMVVESDSEDAEGGGGDSDLEVMAVVSREEVLKEKIKVIAACCISSGAGAAKTTWSLT